MFDELFKIEENWVVFFDLFSKNGNGDSTRPIAEELRKRRPDMKFFFCEEKPHTHKHIDMADEIITERTLKFNYITSKAKYIISPMGFPKHGKKREGQVFIQTWHGSPIKKIYLSRDKNNKSYQRYSKQFRNTDIFCNQGEIHKKNLIEALNLKDEQIFNCGLPRNDILFNSNDEFKKDLKKRLGLPDDKKVILYCPTWRRYDFKAVLPFNLKLFKEKLNDKYVMLIRSHVGKHQWVDENNNPIDVFDNEFSFDGGTYFEATHLYLISDMMISDYSSAIFDFALTRKPQIFYIYDYEEYKNEFDLHYNYNDFSPFPKARNQEELLDKILNYNVSENECEEFVSNYLEYEKGSAAKMIVDYILKEQQ